MNNQHFRKQHCIGDFSDEEHHQHMEIDRLRITEGKQQKESEPLDSLA